MPTEEEIEKAFKVLINAGLLEEPNPDPKPEIKTNGGAFDDPPEEGGLPPIEEWISDYEAGVEARKEKWKRRLRGKGSYVLKRSIESEDKWVDKVRGALALRWQFKVLAVSGTLKSLREKLRKEEFRDMPP